MKGAKFIKLVVILLTSNNLRLGRAFDDLDLRLSLLCQVGGDVIRPYKICRGCQICIPLHSLNQRFPIQFRFQSVLRVRSYYVERNEQSHKQGFQITKWQSCSCICHKNTVITPGEGYPKHCLVGECHWDSETVP